MKRPVAWLFAGLLMASAGCTAEPGAAPVPGAGDVVKGGDAVAPLDSSAPDAAVREIFQGVSDRRPEVVWQALPASYQSDVRGLLRSFAEKMDPELWNSGFSTAKKVVQVLKEKKEFILVNPMLQQSGADLDEVALHWNDVVDALSTVIDSEIGDLDKLRDADVEAFLSGTLADLLKRADALAQVSPAAAAGAYANLESMKDSKVEVVSHDGDWATVKITAPGEEPKSSELVRVEGKWVPKEMAEEWSETIDQARAAIDAISEEELAAVKEQMLGKIKMIDAQLDMLLASESADDFNLKVFGIMALLAADGGFRGGEAPPFGAEGADLPPDDFPPKLPFPKDDDLPPSGGDLPDDDLPGDE